MGGTDDGAEAAERPSMTLEEARARWGWETVLGSGGRPSRVAEDDWLRGMIDWWAGATDGECGRKLGVSPATFGQQRRKRGLSDRDRWLPTRRTRDWADDAADGAPGLRLSPSARERLARELARHAAPAAPEAEPAGEPLPAPPVLRDQQRPPPGDWKTWLFLGGRGAGKTLAGAAWLAHRAKTCGRLALIGPSHLDVREVMVEGPSGLRGLGAAFGPPQGLPRWEATRRRLLFPNGAIARAFSAEDPEGLRGPQFEAAWADEVCAWPKAEETLAQVRMGLRLGADPRLLVTTTPKPSRWLKRLLAEPGLARSTGRAVDNAEWLAPGFVEGLRALYGGTRWERQELDGEVLEALEGAVFRRAEIDRARALGRAQVPPERFERLVLAVDPPAGTGGSACGLVVAGVAGGGVAGGGVAGGGGPAGTGVWVLEDGTAQGLTPLGWAERAAAAAARWAGRGPLEVVAEANQGGEMVRTVLTQGSASLGGAARPVRLVRAALGKRERAEPVALLYEQGRVAHAPGLEALEDQMLLLGAEDARRGDTADRADALVWALTVLVLERRSPGPRARLL